MAAAAVLPAAATPAPPTAAIPNSTLVSSVLAEDQRYRYSGVEGDLFPLRSLSSKPWDYSAPTLAKPCTSFDKSKRSKLNLSGSFSLESDQAKVRESIEKAMPILRGIDLSNLLIAGGFVGKMVTGGHWGNTDIDVFVWGLTPVQASQRISKFISDLFHAQEELLLAKQKEEEEKAKEEKKPMAKRAKAKPTFTFRVVRNPKTLSLTIGSYTKIQIIFRLYQTISEILHGFDLGSSAIGYDGTDVWTTSLGKFAYEYGCNIVDPSRRSTTYEKRIIKYFERGFEVILPQLDMSRLTSMYLAFDEHEMLILPYFQVVYNQLHANRISVKKIFTRKVSGNDVQSVSSSAEHDYGDDLDEYSSFYTNISNIAFSVDCLYHFLQTSGAEASDAKLVLNAPPYMSRRMIIQFYDALPDQIFKEGKFSYARLFRYIAQNESDVSQALFRLPTVTERTKYVIELINQQKELTLKKWDELEKKDYTQIQWMIESPGSQLTSSFNPVLSNPQDWYGSMFLKQ